MIHTSTPEKFYEDSTLYDLFHCEWKSSSDQEKLLIYTSASKNNKDYINSGY